MAKKQRPIPVKIVHDGPSESMRQYREPDRMHMSVRQIKNGFIVNRHGSRGGKHYDEEFYTPKAPNIGIESGKKPPAPSMRSRNERLSKAKL
jgi:hypothetical protein